MEIEYTPTVGLTDVENPASSIKALVDELDSKDWVEVCRALLQLRRLAKFHSSSVLEILPGLIDPILKSVKSPRSALCKTALMAIGDLFTFLGNNLLPHLDSLLLQLLSRASQDKKFVVEEAENALAHMSTALSPRKVLEALEPFIAHRNPKFRAKATTAVLLCASRLDAEGLKEVGLDSLLKIGGKQISDQLPVAREAARKLIIHLRTHFVHEEVERTASGDPPIDPWKAFCEKILPTPDAIAVLRVAS